jgi:hypothetical protein
MGYGLWVLSILVASHYNLLPIAHYPIIRLLDTLTNLQRVLD